MKTPLLFKFGWLWVGWLALGIQIAGAGERPTPPGSETPSPIQVESRAGKTSATLGDIITFDLIVRHDPDIEVEYPGFDGHLEGFEFVEAGSDPPRTRNGKTEQRFWYRLRAGEVGSFTFPKIPVKFKVPDSRNPSKKIEGRIWSGELAVQVRSLLRLQGEPKDIHDIKALEKIERDWPLYLLGPALALLAALAALILARKQRKGPVRKVKTALSPDELALKELEALKARGLLQTGMIREHYFELSEIFRRYLGARYSIPALDWTTEEITGRLSRLDDLDETLRRQADELLMDTDQVKFAKRIVDPDVSDKIMEAMARFIRSTRRVPREEEPRVSTPSALGP